MQQDLFDTNPDLEAAGQDAVRAARAFLTAFEAADAPSREVCAGVWESFAAVANAIKPLIAGRVNHQHAQPGAARTARAAPGSDIAESRKLCRTGAASYPSKIDYHCPVCGVLWKKGDPIWLVSRQNTRPPKFAHPQCTQFCAECAEHGGHGMCERRTGRNK